MAEQNANLKAIRGKAIEVFGSIREFAKNFGITETQMQNKLSGKSGWTLSDIQKAADLFGIRNNESECHRLFF